MKYIVRKACEVKLPVRFVKKVDEKNYEAKLPGKFMK